MKGRILTQTRLIEAIRSQADVQVAVAENLRRLIGLAGSAGVSNADLVQASGLSRSAVAEITVAQGGTHGRGLEAAEIAVVMQYAKNIAIVAAGWVGYREYRAFNAYICQANRHFDSEIERFGFYADQEVKPEFPTILDFERAATFNADTAARLRSEDRNLLAAVVEKVVEVGARDAITPHDVYALSAPDDEDKTLKLDAPIKHATSGPGTGFVQKQRYISKHALERNPRTTRDLLDG